MSSPAPAAFVTHMSPADYASESARKTAEAMRDLPRAIMRQLPPPASPGSLDGNGAEDDDDNDDDEDHHDETPRRRRRRAGSGHRPDSSAKVAGLESRVHILTVQLASEIAQKQDAEAVAVVYEEANKVLEALADAAEAAAVRVTPAKAAPALAHVAESTSAPRATLTTPRATSAADAVDAQSAKEAETHVGALRRYYLASGNVDNAGKAEALFAKHGMGVWTSLEKKYPGTTAGHVPAAAAEAAEVAPQAAQQAASAQPQAGAAEPSPAACTAAARILAGVPSPVVAPHKSAVEKKVLSSASTVVSSADVLALEADRLALRLEGLRAKASSAVSAIPHAIVRRSLERIIRKDCEDMGKAVAALRAAAWRARMREHAFSASWWTMAAALTAVAAYHGLAWWRAQQLD